MLMKRIFVAMIIAVTFAHSYSRAEGGAPPTNRQKVIDFEDSLVEGMNKRPLDSFSQISERDRRKKLHLYRKRSGFRTENQTTLEEMRFTQ